MTGLSELLERVKAATGPDRELDALLAVQFGDVFMREHAAHGISFFEMPIEPNQWAFLSGCKNGQAEAFRSLGECKTVATYTASIDAALALVERALPERWEIDMGTCGPDDMPWACVTEPDEPCRGFASSAPTIPIAMIEALLLALEAQNGK